MKRKKIEVENVDEKEVEKKRQKKFDDLFFVLHELQEDRQLFYQKLNATDAGKQALQTILSAFAEYQQSLLVWSTLPDEMWVHIFHFTTPLHSDNCTSMTCKWTWSIPLVCKKWYDLYWDRVKRRERLLSLRLDYFPQIPSITAHCRTVLVDWLVEVCHYFTLRRQILFLAVHMVDRFCERTTSPFPLESYQLVGIASLRVACRASGEHFITSSDLIFISADTYTVDQMKEMEAMIIQTLHDEMLPSCVFPTSLQFFYRYAQFYPQSICVVARFMVDLALMSSSMLTFLPSLVAAASLYIGITQQSNQRAWSEEDEGITNYSEAELVDCVQALSKIYEDHKNSKFQAVKIYHPNIPDQIEFQTIETL